MKTALSAIRLLRTSKRINSVYSEQEQWRKERSNLNLTPLHTTSNRPQTLCKAKLKNLRSSVLQRLFKNPNCPRHVNLTKQAQWQVCKGTLSVQSPAKRRWRPLSTRTKLRQKPMKAPSFLQSLLLLPNQRWSILQLPLLILLRKKEQDAPVNPLWKRGQRHLSSPKIMKSQTCA